ncbi:MAG: DNA repair protein RecN [Firmicutes bacterium]|nr:DNA repair protein RecN [Bacillota bacterium]
MLKELQISGFALIDQVHLSFDSGFSVITGETGAGKSIIIDALSLLLGTRASSEMIRTGCDQAVVEGLFQPSAGARNLLVEWGMGSAEDDELIIMREIHRTGRNRCRINGHLANVTQLAQLAPYLVDILGQHDTQSLLDVEKHRYILDSFGDAEHQKLRDKISKLYQEYSEIRSRRIKLQTNEKERLVRIDLLQFQVEEIGQAKLQVGEVHRLTADLERLANLDRLSSTAASVYSRFQEDTEGLPSLSRLLSEAVHDLSSIGKYDQTLIPLVENFSNALVLFEEGCRDLRNYVESLESDPQALQDVEERLHLIRSLLRKYGDTEQEVLNYYEQIQQELEELTHSSETVDHLVKQEEHLYQELLQLSAKLTEKRQQCAKELEKNIEAQLADLNMESRFVVEIKQAEQVGAEGLDLIEFKISPNIGEDLKPLAKIASGGEMSRIMLAIKSILAEADQVPTLVFDEVDSGIGGRTALKVADKLHKLSRHFQVFSVTHLPIVASYAKHHYYIEKKVIQDRTVMQVNLLSKEERVNEIVRMLGGHEDVETIAHAKQLLNQANTS